MPTLTLIVPDDWPDPRRECPWILRDERGRTLESGCGGPESWPRPPASADGETQGLPCDLLLAGIQVAVHAAVLPAGNRAQSPEVLAAVLEDDLLDDPARLSFVVLDEGAQAAGAARMVGVLAQARLHALCQRLGELGLYVRSAWPLIFTLPAGEAMWVGGRLNIRFPEPGGMAIAVAELGAWRSALAGAGVDFPLRCGYLADEGGSEGGAEAELLAELAAADRQTLQLLAAPQRLPPGGAGFLYGPLAVPARAPAWRRQLRYPAFLALGFLALALLAALADWGWMAYQAKEYKFTVDREFARIFPGGAQVDAVLQLQRHVDALESAQGRLGAGDFLNLLAPFSEAPALAGRLLALDYGDGRLRARLAGEAGTDVDELLVACRAAGLHCSQERREGMLEVTLSTGEGR